MRKKKSKILKVIKESLNDLRKCLGEPELSDKEFEEWCNKDTKEKFHDNSEEMGGIGDS